MPIVTWRLASSWARAACGVPVGRYIDRPGRSSTSSTRQSSPWSVVVAGPLAAGVVHLPLLGAVGLEDEDVVAVAVHREALRARRREVGVGLAGVAELELEPGDQVGQRRVVAVQPLEDDRRRPRRRARAPCAGRPDRTAGGRRSRRPGGRTTTHRARCRPCATRTAGVRIAVPVSSASASSSESSPTSSAGSVSWTWTSDAQTFEAKVWASPLSRSSAEARARSERGPVGAVGVAAVGAVAVRGVAVGAVGAVAVGAVGVAAVGAVGVAATGQRVGARGGQVAVVQRGVGVFRVVVMRPPVVRIWTADVVGSPGDTSSARDHHCRQSSVARQRRQASLRVTRGEPPVSRRGRGAGRSRPPRCGRTRPACRGCWTRGRSPSWC